VDTKGEPLHPARSASRLIIELNLQTGLASGVQAKDSGEEYMNRYKEQHCSQVQ